MFRFNLILLIFLLSSCSSSSTLNEANEEFAKQYGQDVNRINSQREAFDMQQKPPSIIKDFVVNPEKAKMEHFLQQSEKNLPKDMFDIRYLTVNYPNSYLSPQVSFDDIEIPNHDFYGVESSLGEKNYTLVNNGLLQKNVDYINSTTEYDDREVRLILVREQKELDREKKLKILDLERKKKQREKEEKSKTNDEDKKDQDAKNKDEKNKDIDKNKKDEKQSQKGQEQKS